MPKMTESIFEVYLMFSALPEIIEEVLFSYTAVHHQGAIKML